MRFTFSIFHKRVLQIQTLEKLSEHAWRRLLLLFGRRNFFLLRDLFRRSFNFLNFLKRGLLCDWWVFQDV